jgi:hypothetical protein
LIASTLLAASPAAGPTDNKGGEMTDLASSILLAFIVLSAKHTIGDYILQSPYQFKNKGIYGHPGGILHSALHAILTLPVFLILPPATLILALAIIVGEFVIHYHIDWSKEKLNKRYELTQCNERYWYLFGFDQLAHSITYVAIIALLI